MLTITKMPSEPPQVSDQALGLYLRDLHAVVSGLVTSAAVPNPITNLTITPIAGGNVVQFTRSNAPNFVLFLSDSPDRAAATQIALGTANSYTDNVGQGGRQRYYWVVATAYNGSPSTVVGPKSGTTLALGTPASPIPLVPQSFAQVYDTTVNRLRPVITTTDPEVSGQPSSPVE